MNVVIARGVTLIFTPHNETHYALNKTFCFYMYILNSITYYTLGSSGYGSHSTVVNATYKDNYSKGFKYGYVLRGDGDVVENNIIESSGYAAVEVAFGGKHLITKNISKGSKAPYFIYEFKDHSGEARVTYNKSSNTTKWFNTSRGIRTAKNQKV